MQVRVEGAWRKEQWGLHRTWDRTLPNPVPLEEVLKRGKGVERKLRAGRKHEGGALERHLNLARLEVRPIRNEGRGVDPVAQAARFASARLPARLTDCADHRPLSQAPAHDVNAAAALGAPEEISRLKLPEHVAHLGALYGADVLADSQPHAVRACA